MAQRRALLIGNKTYNSIAFESLPYVDADLGLMQSALLRMKYTYTCVVDQTRDELISALEEFIDYEDAGENDINIIYYSGHGTISENHFCIVTARGEDEGYNTLRLEDVAKKTVGKPGSFLIVLDACRRGLSSVSGSEAFPKFSDRNLYVIYSTGTGEDSLMGRCSHFTECFCRNMLQPGIGLGKLLADTICDMEESGYEQQIPVSINQMKKDPVIYPIPFEVLPEENGKKTVFSMMDVEEKLQREAKYPGFGLDFFDLDDDRFAIKLELAIRSESVYVVGKSKEETLYRVLNEIRRKYNDRTVFVIESENQWQKLMESDTEDTILIPFFRSEGATAAKSGNTTIFFFDEDEPCPYRERIKLHKRTTDNLRQALRDLEVPSEEEDKIIRNTKGRFAALKKYLFKGNMHQMPAWANSDNPTILTALLCGKWTELSADHSALEKLSGLSYEEIQKELRPLFYGPDPLLIESNTYEGKIIQVAAYEDSWELLKEQIRPELWDHFKQVFEEGIISGLSKKVEHGQDFFRLMVADKTELSQVIQEGMIRSLIMYACDDEGQNQENVDTIIRKILHSVKNENEWRILTALMMDLCEASPEAMMGRLEQELINDTGLRNLFPKAGEEIEFGSNQYLNTLWAIEYLLQLPQYVSRAVKWLWESDRLWRPDFQKQTQIDLLERVFSPFCNVCALTNAEKIISAEIAVEKYERAWEVFSRELPSSGGTVLMLARPEYRLTAKNEPVIDTEYRECISRYLWLCIELCKDHTERWISVLNCLNYFESDIIQKALNELVNYCSKMVDSCKFIIKEQIREIIGNHRKYATADWAMDEERIRLFDECFRKIEYSSPEYDYLFLFFADYDFPLMHPFNADEDEKNDHLRDREINGKIDEFKSRDLQISVLIKAAESQEKCNCLGKVLAQYYCGGKYNQKVFEELIGSGINTRQIRDYFLTLMRGGEQIELNALVIFTKTITDQADVICTILNLEIIQDWKSAMILQQPEAIKTYYWENLYLPDVSKEADEETRIQILKECQKYAPLKQSIQLLFELRDGMKPESVLKVLQEILSGPDQTTEPMIGYWIKEMLKELRTVFSEDGDQRLAIAGIEWQCRNLLKWEEMEFFRQEMIENPALYARLIEIVCKKESETEDPARTKIAQQFLSAYKKAKFCPANINGKVDKDKLVRWINGFRILLEKQEQGHIWSRLVGRLLSFAPKGEDGNEPCEAVREVIEEFMDEELMGAYFRGIVDQRGVHAVTAGKAELALAEQYFQNAEEIKIRNPQTARIYYRLSKYYRQESKWDRERAEDE